LLSSGVSREDINGFTQEEIDIFQKIIENSANLIMEFAKDGVLKMPQVFRWGILAKSLIIVRPWSLYLSGIHFLKQFVNTLKFPCGMPPDFPQWCACRDNIATSCEMKSSE
jgi:hypothetical protein